MELSHEDVLTILKLIDESHFAEIRIEIGDLKLHVRKRDETGLASVDGQSPERVPTWATSRSESLPSNAARAASALATGPDPRATLPAESGPTSAAIPTGLMAVRAPMLGTFYRAPSPGAPPFCEVGNHVEPNDTVCLIEVMKLFNSIPAGVAGRVEQILVENAALVEYNQPLILIRPDATP